MHYFMAKNNDWKPWLLKELEGHFPNSKVRSYQNLPLLSVDSGTSIKNHNIGFSLCCLPNAITLKEDSIGNQASKISELILQELGKEKSLALNVFSLTEKYGVITNGRAEIMREKIIKKLRKQNISLKRSVPVSEKAQVQILINRDRSLLFSLIKKEEMESYAQLLSPFPGGFTTVKEDKSAPSRAYRKIVEAQKVLGREMEKGQQIVDLGACPGGWTYIARNQGARVVAIDRSELREDLMDDNDVDFISEDAFKYQHPQVVDWVVSDVICTPHRIFELMENWVKTERCHNFVFTIKFQGTEDYSILIKFHEIIEDTPNYYCLLRQLNTNKNEVMIMGRKI